jgi:hypothetical protein
MQQQGFSELVSNESWCLSPVIGISHSKGNWTRCHYEGSYVVVFFAQEVDISNGQSYLQRW